MSTTNPTPSAPFPTPSSKLPPSGSPLPAPSSPLRRGRPRALNDVKMHQILTLIARGCSIEEAARHAGCAASTIRREARRDPEWGEELRRYLLDAELFALNAVRSAARRHWRAGRWLLERNAAERIREQNRRSLTARRLRILTSAIATALESEIQDGDERRRVAERLKEVVRDTNRSFAAMSLPPVRRHKPRAYTLALSENSPAPIAQQ